MPLRACGPAYVIPIPDYRLDFSLEEGESLGEESGVYAIDFDDPRTYYSDAHRAYLAVESLIIPISGRWGVLVSDSSHAVAAASRHFVDTVLSNVTLDPDEMTCSSCGGGRNSEKAGSRARGCLPSSRQCTGRRRSLGSRQSRSFSPSGSHSGNTVPGDVPVAWRDESAAQAGVEAACCESGELSEVACVDRRVANGGDEVEPGAVA